MAVRTKHVADVLHSVNSQPHGSFYHFLILDRKVVNTVHGCILQIKWQKLKKGRFFKAQMKLNKLLVEWEDLNGIFAFNE